MTPSPSAVAAVASAASAPDPVLTIIASAFGGAILTVIGGLITHALTGRRERLRWSLELRSRVYEDAIFHMWERNYQLHQHEQQFPSAPRVFDQSDFEDARRADALLMYAGSQPILKAYQQWATVVDIGFRTHNTLWEQVRETVGKKKQVPESTVRISKETLVELQDHARDAACTATVLMGIDVGLRGGRREQNLWKRIKNRKPKDGAGDVSQRPPVGSVP